MTNPRTMRDHLRGQLRDYLTLASGSMGRLVIALAYFLVAANVLSLADFGLFATASGAGIVLSRVAAFGFISPLFRAATVRPRLTGTYLAGYLVLFALSIPLLVAIAAGLRLTVFSAMPLSALVLILCAEVLGWRMLEVVAIINNGLRAFGKSTTLILAGSAIRTLAALAFWWFGYSSLTEWAWTYLAANLVAAALAFSVFLPPLRLRLRLALYGRQMRDALPAAAADIIFYLQAELDKAVVLVMAGPHVAGLYAIAMRIIDLTAMPIRSFNQLAMQKIMTDRRVSTSTPMLLLVELAIAAVSLGGLLAAMALLWWNPLVLGRNIGAASALFPLLLAVPALRNLIEYHSELLYGLERTGLRAALLATIAVLKAGLLALVISLSTTELGWAPWLNAIFVVLYAVSAATIWRVIRQR
jgi:O-antigen/teichoic acid export membrane protein